MTMQINGTSGLVFNDASTQNTAASGFGFKNRLINGAMMIDQRNAGASVTPNNSYTLDRWATVNTQTSKFTIQQNAGSVTPPAGFVKYLGVTSSSAYSVGSGDTFAIYQPVEGLNVYDLGWGTANAKTVTLSASVYSSLTGTFGGSITNGSLSYPFSYTISSANTWTQISVTIVGPTTGTWATNNTSAFSLYFGLGSGSTFTSTAGSWQAGNFVQSTNSVSVVGTNGATFYITGVQLEKGSTATSFDYRPYGTELALCQRYYWRSSASSFNAIGAGVCNSTTSARVYIKHPVAMRAFPTFAYSGTVYVMTANGSAQTISAIAATYAGFDSTRLDVTTSGQTAGSGTILFVDDAANNLVSASSEL